LKFYASVRLRVARKENLKQGTDNVGARTIVKIVKNKLAPPFRECEFDIMFGKGISRAGCLIDYGLAQGLISRSGTWFSYGQERLGQGREGARDFIETNADVMVEIENKIREKIGLPQVSTNGAAAGEPAKTAKKEK
jgi:recombination protein RecA